jgi:hypothetical protein
MRVMVLVVMVITAACSSSRPPTQVAPSDSSGKGPQPFCDLYRRDANDGELRNWDLNDNAKTPGYTNTLRALADAAPPELKSDIARILSYYATPEPKVSPAEYQAGLRSGERVLAYVHDRCGIDTTGTPPGDTSSTAP